VRGISNRYALTRCSLPWRARTVIQRETIDGVRRIDGMPAKCGRRGKENAIEVLWGRGWEAGDGG
jgi:hypothetical protein